MDKPILIGLFCLALSLRLGAVIGIHIWLVEHNRDYLIAGDADGYWQLGQRLSQGRSYEIYQPPRQVMRMPGYPAFIAACVTIFGDSRLPVRLVQACLSALGVVILVQLATIFFDQKTAILSGIILSLSPAAVGFSALLLSETCFAVMLVLNLWLAARWLKSNPTQAAYVQAIVVGVSTMAVVYVRPTWLPALIVWGVLAILYRSRRYRSMEALLVVFTGLVCLAPWAYRNYQVTGHWVLTTLWVGPSLYDGFHPEATGASDMSFFDRDQVMRSNQLSEYEMDRYYRQQAWDYGTSNPYRSVQLMLAHAQRFWSLTPNAEQFRRSLLMYPLALWNLLFLVLGLAGGWTLRRQLLPLIVIVGPLLAFAAIHTIFIGSLRYRLPAEYPFCIAVAIGLSEWSNRIRHGRRSPDWKSEVTP